jgi:cellulose synthase (UDP-forming)
LSIVWTAFFAQWWFQPEHIPTSVHGQWGHVADVLLFLLVTYVVWHPIIMQVFYWALAYQIDDPQERTPEPGLRVAFITTYVPQSESIELLSACLPAMLCADYSHDTWLLDEGDVPEVRDLCSALGVHHFSRRDIDRYNADSGTFAKRTKGGNHNAWYDQHKDQYDIVAQLDTDFVPQRNFLTRTLGYFCDPAVGFVGTPQIYGNTDKSFIARGAAEQVYNFYGPLLRGFCGMDTTVMIGANHVVRVAALKDVGLYSAHITEDLLTGMKIHANGWKSVYVPEPLAVGEGPVTWPAYFNQQMRWAFGCIDVLFKYSPTLFRRMSFRRAVYYFLLQQHYFSGIAMTLGLAGLGLYAALGITTAAVSLFSFLLYYVPSIIVCELMALWLQRFNVRPNVEHGLLLAGRIVSIAAWPIFFLAFVGVVTGKRLTYKVTPKGESPSKSSSPLLPTFAAHLAIAAYSFLCVIVAIVRHHISYAILFWLLLSGSLMLCVPLSVPAYDALRKLQRTKDTGIAR